MRGQRGTDPGIHGSNGRVCLVNEAPSLLLMTAVQRSFTVSLGGEHAYRIVAKGSSGFVPGVPATSQATFALLVA